MIGALRITSKSAFIVRTPTSADTKSIPGWRECQPDSRILYWRHLASSLKMHAALLMLVVIAGVMGGTTSSLSDMDSLALLDFKAIISSPDLLNWNGTVCSDANTTDWIGVTCKGGRVAGVELVNYRTILSGPLPASWSNLTSLETLSLGQNSLTGTLPSSWAGMANLQKMDFNKNKLRGTLPPAWASMTQMQVLDFSYNQLTGTMPSSWASMTNLTVCSFRENTLTGALPSSWASMANMTSLEIYNNNFTGTLPPEWALLFADPTAFPPNLDLSGNRLSGMLPSSWSNMTSLRTLDLSHNNFGGTLPPSWLRLQRLELLDLNHNNLTGRLPESWASLFPVYRNSPGTLDVTSNKLTGTLPSSWGYMAGLTTLYASSNRLTGTFPSSWSNITKFETLYLVNNSLTGMLPLSWAVMQNLLDVKICSNNLTGTLPESWSNMTRLESLDLHENSLTGTLPASWQSQQRLDLSHNNLTGSLPANWSHMSLETLSLSGNSLTGPLPAIWSNLTTLKAADLSNNNFTGTLPSSWVALMKLQSITLSQNRLTGTLPAEWASLPAYDLNISSNNLSGTLPAQWLSGISGLAVNISLLDLSFNKLTGSIPAEAGGKFLAGNRSDGIAAAVILDPMSSPFSMCGPIPEKMHVVSATGAPLNHTMPGGQCPGGKRTTVIASAVAACAAVAILLAVTLVTWQVRKRRALSAKLSYSALLKLQANPKNGLKVEFDNVGNPRLLGKGGFGEVYKARWNGVPVAVKALIGEDRAEAEAFQREIAVLEVLRHPHVVNYLATLVAEDGTVFLVTEFMPGGDLGKHIRGDKATPRQTGWYRNGRFIALGIARGLVYLHSRGIVWFDCKPGNVLLDQTGLFAKIADFGLAKVLESTYTSAFARGTIGYMAPELLGQDEDTLDSKFLGNASVDVFGYGRMLWQILSGESIQENVKRMPRVPEELCTPSRLAFSPYLVSHNHSLQALP
ncbi:hypothetical protein WJX75_008211 [Coccomyxa subellipsoidea]|uniref:Protein kinase domain-containing protein n=1 Tax=Coccomyxa subellipsoidea TaxID=248742 RepID=A0ABR2YLD6_9CHLO